MHWINGKWIQGKGKEFISYNPANLQTVWQGNSATEAEIILAGEAANKAFPHWSNLTVHQRLNYLEKFTQLLQASKDQFAEYISIENGKPFWEAKTEVAAMLGKLKISLAAYEERTGLNEQSMDFGIAKTWHRSNGVLAVLGPFNFPGHLPNGHITPALLAGNTIIFKPSEYTPHVAEMLCKLWQEAGLPNGVLNLVQGKGEVGKAILDLPDIDGCLFTGSYATGKAINQQWAAYPERLIALEMGGNNPLVAFDVADIDACVYMIIQSAFITSGQRCTCARRLILPSDQKGDAILQKLIDVTKQLTIGSYKQTPEPFMGPIISDVQEQNILATQAKLTQLGAKSLLTSELISDHGHFVSPGIIDTTDITRDDYECFGPFLQVIRVNDFSNAIALANHTQYGLAAGLLSDNKELFPEFCSKIKAGLINLNRPLTGASSQAPFGGVGRSGNHRPSAFYAADYSAHPVASLQSEKLILPKQLTPGVFI